jgi:hypothetical protein
MFQQPGASKQPAGILASSPELANVVQRQQPVRMAQGGDVGLQKAVGQLEALKQSGDVESLKRVANDPSAPDLVRRIANNFADSLLPDSVPLIEVGDVNLGNALSDATNRNPIGQSAGGQERSAAITPVGNVGDVNLSNALSDFSGRKPIGQSAGGQERSAALKAVPGKIGAAISEGFDELTRVRGPALKDVEGPLPDSPFKNILDMFRSDASAAPQSVQSPPDFKPSTTMDSSVDSMSRIGSSMSQDTLNKIRAARGLPPVAATTDSLVGSARVTSPAEEGVFSVLAKNQAETVARMATAAEQSDRLTDPSMLLPQTGEAPTPVSPLVSDAMKYENMYGTGDLNLGETLAATTTPTQDKAATDAGASTDNPFAVNKKPAVNEGNKKPSVSQQKLGKLLRKAEDGTLVTGGDAPKKPAVKLNAAEAATPEAAATLSMVLPEKTSLSEMEKQAKEIMGFDPSRASESKSASFWRNLTMAGLAIAAGESENALTNVAKGLMVGMDSYSKDIKDLNEMEAEERKEYRATLRDLVKTDKDEKIALATMQNNFKYRLADLNQKRDQFESDAAYKQQELGLRTSLANRQLEAGLLRDIATLELQGKTLDETMSQNTIKNRMDKLKALPDFVQNAVQLGYGTIDEKGNFSWNEKGQAWVTENASAVLRASITDSAKTGKVAPTREAYILDSLGKEFALDSARQDMKRMGIDNPTGDQLREYFGTQYDSTLSGTASAAPAAVDPASVPVGTRMRDSVTGAIVVKQADGTFLPEATGN